MRSALKSNDRLHATSLTVWLNNKQWAHCIVFDMLLGRRVEVFIISYPHGREHLRLCAMFIDEGASLK